MGNRVLKAAKPAQLPLHQRGLAGQQFDRPQLGSPANSPHGSFALELRTASIGMIGAACVTDKISQE